MGGSGNKFHGTGGSVAHILHRDYGGQQTAFIELHFFEGIIGHEAFGVATYAFVHSVGNVVGRAASVPDAHFVERTLEGLVVGIVVLASTKQDVVGIDCGKCGGGYLLEGFAVDVDGGVARGALQHVECNMVPLVVAVVGSGNFVVRTVGSHDEVSVSGEMDVELVRGVESDDAGLAGLCRFGAEPEFGGVAVVVVCSDGGGLSCHYGTSLELEGIVVGTEMPCGGRGHGERAAAGIVGSGVAASLVESPVCHDSLAVAGLLFVHCSLCQAPRTGVVPERHFVHLSGKSLSKGDVSDTVVGSYCLFFEERNGVSIVGIVGRKDLLVGIVAEAEELPLVLLQLVLADVGFTADVDFKVSGAVDSYRHPVVGSAVCEDFAVGAIAQPHVDGKGAVLEVDACTGTCSFASGEVHGHIVCNGGVVEFAGDDEVVD